jgi:hypothetical protein
MAKVAAITAFFMPLIWVASVGATQELSNKKLLFSATQLPDLQLVEKFFDIQAMSSRIRVAYLTPDGGNEPQDIFLNCETGETFSLESPILIPVTNAECPEVCPKRCDQRSKGKSSNSQIFELSSPSYVLLYDSSLRAVGQVEASISGVDGGYYFSDPTWAAGMNSKVLDAKWGALRGSGARAVLGVGTSENGPYVVLPFSASTDF